MSFVGVERLFKQTARRWSLSVIQQHCAGYIRISVTNRGENSRAEHLLATLLVER